MNDFVCKNCGNNTYFTELKNGQNVASCEKCNTFYKNLPNESEAVLYFGKYKGSIISQMSTKEEINYLNWLLTSEIKLSSKIKTAVQKKLGLWK